MTMSGSEIKMKMKITIMKRMKSTIKIKSKILVHASQD
jgi:hypothetical protein